VFLKGKPDVGRRVIGEANIAAKQEYKAATRQSPARKDASARLKRRRPWSERSPTSENSVFAPVVGPVNRRRPSRLKSNGRRKSRSQD